MRWPSEEALGQMVVADVAVVEMSNVLLLLMVYALWIRMRSVALTTKV